MRYKNTKYDIYEAAAFAPVPRQKWEIILVPKTNNHKQDNSRSCLRKFAYGNVYVDR